MWEACRNYRHNDSSGQKVMSEQRLPSDGLAHAFPVSLKGVIVSDGRVVLLKNEREEWELPGGKLEPGERPEDCLRREITEELSVSVGTMKIIDCWLYNIQGTVEVLIVTFGCEVDHAPSFQLSPEHKELDLFLPSELEAIEIPEGYRKSIRTWLSRSAGVSHP